MQQTSYDRGQTREIFQRSHINVSSKSIISESIFIFDIERMTAGNDLVESYT